MISQAAWGKHGLRVGLRLSGTGTFWKLCVALGHRCLNGSEHHVVGHFDRVRVRLDARRGGVERGHFSDNANWVKLVEWFMDRQLVEDWLLGDSGWDGHGDGLSHDSLRHDGTAHDGAAHGGIAHHEPIWDRRRLHRRPRNLAVHDVRRRAFADHGTDALARRGSCLRSPLNPILDAAGHDPPRRLLLLLGQRAHVIVGAGTQEHEALRLEHGILADVVLPDGAHGHGRRRHAVLPRAAISTAPTARSPRVAGARARLPLDLLLRLEAFLRGQGRGGRGGVDEIGELIALLGEVVLDVAGGLVLVEPPLAVVVPLPVFGKARHGVFVARLRVCRGGISFSPFWIALVL